MLKNPLLNIWIITMHERIFQTKPIDSSAVIRSFVIFAFKSWSNYIL
jgi:hypothetical protein